MRRGQRQGTAGERQIFGDQLRAEHGQEMISAISGAGLVEQPRKGDGQLHAGTMRPRRRPVTIASSLPNWAHPLECAFIKHGARRLPMNEPLVVRREVQIAAPPATVFAFLTDPQKILRWMGTEATTEPHPGGLYLGTVTGKDRARR